jgi:hypothetical protein
MSNALPLLRVLLLALAIAGMGCASTCSNTIVHAAQESDGSQSAQVVTTCDPGFPNKNTVAYCRNVPTPDDGQMHYCKMQWGKDGTVSSGALVGPTEWININVFNH